MNGDLLHNAGELYKAGDKQGAAELLEQYLQKNPDDADAWYGLALCATDPVEQRTYLFKALESNPEHPKARQALDKLELNDEGIAEPPASLTGYAVHESEIEDHEDGLPESNRRSILFPVFSSIVIILLISAVIWLWYRLDKVEKSLIQAQGDIASHSSSIVTMNNNIGVMKSDISTIEGDISVLYAENTRLDRNVGVLDAEITRLDGNIGGLSSNISGLSSDLSYVSSIASNANNYAHSHPYSDVRLKENLVQVDDPIGKLAKLQGVYFNWTGEAQDKFGLGSDTEIGLIAQDVAQVFPEVVTQDENGYLMVDYERLVPVIIEAIQVQQDEIQQLRGQHIQLYTSGN